jgi:hypothetical protein
MDISEIYKSMKNGSLRLVSSTGFSMPVTNPKPKVSKNWGSGRSFDQLCEECRFCYRFPDSKNKDLIRPHVVIEDEVDGLDGKRISFILLCYDRYGLCISADGTMPASWLNDPGLEISKSLKQMALDYLVQTGASDLIIP